VPYLTPQSIPEERDCRALLIPASSEWLALFGGALTELSLRYNWEQQGISIDDTLAVINEVLQGYYDGCTASGCTLPDGSAIVRLNPETWLIEQLVNGEWVTPQGDYEMPPTPARTEPTPQERICLASANAVNALHLLYESLSDSFAEALGLQAAINAAIAIFIGIVGTAFALPVAALIGIAIIIMSIVYETIEFVTADLWDEDFTNILVCYFEDCATDNASVVHFDLQCIINRIGGAIPLTPEIEPYVRLMLQVSYLLNTLGSQAIDAAGATDQISSWACLCPQEWCNEFGASGIPFDEDWTPESIYGTVTATDMTGVPVSGSSSAIWVHALAPCGGQLWQRIKVTMEATGLGIDNGIQCFGDGTSNTGTFPLVEGEETYDLEILTPDTSDAVFHINAYSNDTAATFVITKVVLCGEGTGQPFCESNCDEC